MVKKEKEGILKADENIMFILHSTFFYGVFLGGASLVENKSIQKHENALSHQNIYLKYVHVSIGI